MVDVPTSLFVGAALFLMGMILVDVFWDIRALESPYTETTWAAIAAFYTNNVVGTRQRAPYLMAPFPLAFLVVFGTLLYRCVHGWSSGDGRELRLAGVTLAVLFPLIVLASASTFPTIAAIIRDDRSVLLAHRQRLHRRMFLHHAAYLVLTGLAVVLQYVF